MILKSYETKVQSTADSYGQPTLVAGEDILMSIQLRQQSLNGDPRLSDAEYTGFTFGSITDKTIIRSEYGDLRVEYITPCPSRGCKVVYLKRV